MAPKDPDPEKEVCPECGVDLANRDVWAHALGHWPERIPDYPETRLARERQAYLRDLAKSRGEI